MTKTPESSDSLSDAPDAWEPHGLAERGSRLWRLLEGNVAGNPAAVVLLEEACRVADRLDGLDRILRGENRELLTVAIDDVGEYRFYVDAALSEARMQANTLRQLVAALPSKESAVDTDDPDAWLAGLSSPVRDS